MWSWHWARIENGRVFRDNTQRRCWLTLCFLRVYCGFLWMCIIQRMGSGDYDSTVMICYICSLPSCKRMKIVNISGGLRVSLCVCIWRWETVSSQFPWSSSPWGSIHLSRFPVGYVSQSSLLSNRVNNIHCFWPAPAHIFDLKPCPLCSMLYLQVLCSMNHLKTTFMSF